MFQSTHPHGVRHEAGAWIGTDARFQSTHPHGVRLSSVTSGFTDISFNPRTHTGCDHNTSPASRPCPPCFNPRTHTGCDFPPYGVGVLGDGVSIHAPTRGATNRAVRGCHVLLVSIHAPTRGATDLELIVNTITSGFNPRTHTGCDLTLRKADNPDGLFQSTHPHGVRQPTSEGADPPTEFQSTHPHGVRRGQRRTNRLRA